MPTRSKRPCAASLCPELVDSGRFCRTHQGEAYRRQDANRPGSTARGYGAFWRRLRAAVLRREPLCRACAAAGRVTAAREVDHIVPRRAGGPDASSNLQGLCKPCHSAKTMRESIARRHPEGDVGCLGGRQS